MRLSEAERNELNKLVEENVVQCSFCEFSKDNYCHEEDCKVLAARSILRLEESIHEQEHELDRLGRGLFPSWQLHDWALVKEIPDKECWYQCRHCERVIGQIFGILRPPGWTRPVPDRNGCTGKECVPGYRCNKRRGCIMALHHAPPCRIEKPTLCESCGAKPWEACDMNKHT